MFSPDIFIFLCPQGTVPVHAKPMRAIKVSVKVYRLAIVFGEAIISNNKVGKCDAKCSARTGFI